MYSFENAVESDGVGGIVVAGKSVYEDGIATCSFLFMDACDEEDLDENGELALAVYTFKPLSDDYDLDAFCLWATSYSISDTEIVEQVKTFGQTDLKESHTVKVTAKPEESAPSSSGSVKWYVYVIATVLAVGVIVGIAVVAVKNAQKHEEENAGNRRSGTDGEHEEKSETAQTSDASDESDQSGE